MYNLVDLFAGTGAFSYAFEQTKLVQTVFANDMCKNSKKIYDLNHSTKLTQQPLDTIPTTNIPPHDILCAGFPCQPFSIAGEQKGFDDKRANVFWKIIDIIRHHKPKLVILENVKNLQSHDKGRTFPVILSNLDNYDVHYKILNTCKISNIPQNRERIYIVCFRKSTPSFNFEFPLPIQPLKISDLLLPDIPDKYYYSNRYKGWDKIKEAITKNVTEHNVFYQYRRYYVRENKSNVCPTLTANMGGGGHNVPLLKDKKGIRKLTPRECFNFQGFPTDYKLPEISDGGLYKLAGNAVSVPVVQLLANKLMPLMIQDYPPTED